MSRKRVHSVITVAALAGLVVFSFSLGASAQSVSGVVRDTRGRGVAGAQVAIARATGTVQVTTERDGSFSSNADAMGGPVRITASAKGFEEGAAEDKAPKHSPGCSATITLLRKHDRPVDSPNAVECRHYTPYSSTPPLKAAWNSPDGSFPPDTGAIMNIGSHFEPGGGKTTGMYLNGAYVFQSSPPVPKAIMVLVTPLPDGAIWSISDQDVVSLTPLTSTTQRLEFRKDGDAEILIQNSERAVLRIHINSHTFVDTWQVKMTRVTDTGEVIWDDGSFGEQ